MTERELQVFVDGAARYFQQVAARPPFVDSPYLRTDEGRGVILDYTGLIGVSGPRRGQVFFSAGRGMVHRVLEELGEPDHSPANCCDLVGEMANTVSGNAREMFGREFQISVPMVFEGGEHPVLTHAADPRTFVIPIRWESFRAHLVVAFEG